MNQMGRQGALPKCNENDFREKDSSSVLVTMISQQKDRKKMINSAQWCNTYFNSLYVQVVINYGNSTFGVTQLTALVMRGCTIIFLYYKVVSLINKL